MTLDWTTAWASLPTAGGHVDRLTTLTVVYLRATVNSPFPGLCGDPTNCRRLWVAAIETERDSNTVRDRERVWERERGRVKPIFALNYEKANKLLRVVHVCVCVQYPVHFRWFNTPPPLHPPPPMSGTTMMRLVRLI